MMIYTIFGFYVGILRSNLSYKTGRTRGEVIERLLDTLMA